jgi:hypothetical protein
MGQHTIHITKDKDKLECKRLIDLAPVGTFVTFKRDKRSKDQNSYMWALLRIVSEQMRWNGNDWQISNIGGKYSTEDWKQVFASALFKTQFMPDLDGGMLPLSPRTSTMSVQQHSELCDLIKNQCDSWGINIEEVEQNEEL